LTGAQTDSGEILVSSSNLVIQCNLQNPDWTHLILSSSSSSPCMEYAILRRQAARAGSSSGVDRSEHGASCCLPCRSPSPVKSIPTKPVPRIHLAPRQADSNMVVTLSDEQLDAHGDRLKCAVAIVTGMHTHTYMCPRHACRSRVDRCRERHRQSHCYQASALWVCVRHDAS
jgi:hypothetical protein